MSTSDMGAPFQRDGAGLKLCLPNQSHWGRDYSSVREMSVRWPTHVQVCDSSRHSASCARMIL